MDFHSEKTVAIFKQEANYKMLLTKNYGQAMDILMKPIKNGLIKPGNRVVIKPNMVKEAHIFKKNEWEQIITNGAVIEFTLKCVVEALKNKGEIFIVDAPQTDSDYEKIIEKINLANIVSRIQNETMIKIHYYDLREERWFQNDGVIVRKKKLRGDPLGYTEVNLGHNSMFFGKKILNFMAQIMTEVN